MIINQGHTKKKHFPSKWVLFNSFCCISFNSATKQYRIMLLQLLWRNWNVWIISSFWLHSDVDGLPTPDSIILTQWRRSCNRLFLIKSLNWLLMNFWVSKGQRSKFINFGKKGLPLSHNQSLWGWRRRQARLAFGASLVISFTDWTELLQVLDDPTRPALWHRNT